MGYQDYLKSPEWKELARRVKERDRCCVLCSSTKNLEAHHRTYVRVCNEELGDLVTVCDRCHTFYHAAAKILPPPRAEWVEDLRWGEDAKPATAEEVAGFMSELGKKLGWTEGGQS